MMAFHTNSMHSPCLKCFVPSFFDENKAFTMFFNCKKYKSIYMLHNVLYMLIIPDEKGKLAKKVYWMD